MAGFHEEYYCGEKMESSGHWIVDWEKRQTEICSKKELFALLYSSFLQQIEGYYNTLNAMACSLFCAESDREVMMIGTLAPITALPVFRPAK